MDKEIIDDYEYFKLFKRYDYLICYGAGAKGEQTSALLKEKNISIDFFVDSNKEKWGRSIDGVQIVSYKMIKHLKNYCIIITTVYKTALIIEDYLRNEGETNPIVFFANPFKSEVKLLTKKEALRDNNAKNTYELLSDEKSRNIWIDFINWKITGCHSYTTRHTEGGWLEFFASDVIPRHSEYTYIDVGAYTGDTILRFLAFSRGDYNRIIAFEPDEANYSRLLEFIDDGRLPLPHKDIIKCGLWSEETQLLLYTPGDGERYESSNFYNNTNMIMPSERAESQKEKGGYYVDVKKMDQYIDLISGKVLIKIDALSSEYEILVGAVNVIKKHKPVIIMELGTRFSNLFKTVPFLKSLNSDYCFYIRQLKTFDNSRTIMIARDKND